MHNNNRNLNFHLYEQQLSPFGKRVLNTLVCFYRREEHDRRDATVLSNRIKPVQNKKILNFGTHYKHNNKETFQRNDASFGMQNSFEMDEPSFYNLEENAMEIIHNNTVNNVSDHLLASTDLVSEITKDIIGDVFMNDSPIHNHMILPIDDVDVAKEINNNSKNNWDAMFDIDVLTTSDMVMQVDQQVEDKSLNNVDVSNTTCEDLCKSNPVGKKNKAKSVLERKDTKKVKKDDTEKPKNNYRKQTYTKVVKNWLENMNVNETNESKTKTSVNEEDVSSVNTENTNYEIQIEKVSKKISKKKVIQSKLANKDGIMKYSKPIPITTEQIQKDSDNTEGLFKAKGSETKVKKAKPKFTAPIKSQIIVRDITYNVHDVNDKFDQRTLINIKDQTITAVLFYSNGFCQLNRQYTDDSCQPVGVIVYFTDNFYVFKSGFHKKILENIFNNNKINCYDGKDILVYLISEEIECKTCNFIDVKIGTRLLDPDNPPENFSDVQKVLSFTPSYTVATECNQQKTAWYITLLDELVEQVVGALVAAPLWNVFVEIEMKLLPIIAGMEHKGVKVDMTKLRSMEDMLLNKMKEVETECHKAAGKTFQINSTVQVRAILYDELGLDTKCNVKIRETICKGAKSTSETMLRSLVSVHPLPKLILEYRHLHKAHATFLTGIAQHVNNGIVRPTWVQTAAVTGRIASNNPNLQAIPKVPFSLVMFPEEGTKESPILSFRSVYVSREGSSFLAADFKHIECRVFAHAAADTGLMDALKSQHDLFKILAAKWLKKPENEVKSEDRERTKRIVYASLYGAGTRKLMDILNISYEETLAVTASFNRTFPALKSFGRSVVNRCEQNGGKLSTICGRMRCFKNITSGDFALKSQAERQAVNFVVQGSAADVCKTAMVLTEGRLRDTVPLISSHLLLQIHDELVWEVADEDIKRAAAIIKEVMEDCGRHCSLTIPLPVSISIGKNWGEMIEYNEF